MKLPKGFSHATDFARYVYEAINADYSTHSSGYDETAADLRFFLGDQWPESAARRRKSRKKPVLTINRLPAMIGQILGVKMKSRLAINVHPDRQGTAKIAQLRQGLIRGIEKLSDADAAYTRALVNAAISGEGAFKVEVVTSKNDVFMNEAQITQIASPTNVVWDGLSVSPTGADASRVSEIWYMRRGQFERTYPGVTPSQGTLFHHVLPTQYASLGAFGADQEFVPIVTHWRMLTKKVKLARLISGETVELDADADTESLVGSVQRNAITGEMYVRTVDMPYCEVTHICGDTLLQEPMELPVSRVPVFRVSGMTLFEGSKRTSFGIVRFARDPAMFHNYWRSIEAEQLSRSVVQKFIADGRVVAGYEDEWNNAHVTDSVLLRYNSEHGPMPAEVNRPSYDTALANAAANTLQDMKDVTGIHEATMGAQSNERSGVAIDRRVSMAEVGSYVYTRSLEDAIAACGTLLNELLPVVYFEPGRAVMLVEDRGTHEMTSVENINMPESPDSSELGRGKYLVTCTPGPSHATQAIASQEALTGLANAMPDVMRFGADLIVGMMDVPGAQELAKRLRKALPPGMAEPNMNDPDEAAAAQQEAEAAQQQQRLQDEQLALQMRELAAKIDKLEAEAALKRAQAEKTEVEATAVLLSDDADDLAMKRSGQP